MSRVEGIMSRVERKMSRVEGKMSRVHYIQALSQKARILRSFLHHSTVYIFVYD